jgi:hypothetical protein
MDVVYPTGSYAHWIDPNDHAQGLHFNREREGAVHAVWHVGCPENMGGCGASVTGLDREGAIAAWSRRPLVRRGTLGDGTPWMGTIEEVLADAQEAASVERAWRKAERSGMEKHLASAHAWDCSTHSSGEGFLGLNRTMTCTCGWDERLREALKMLAASGHHDLAKKS